MPELPDLVVLARSMDEALRGRRVAAVAVQQPRCLNVPPQALGEALVGSTLLGTRQRGKWALTSLAGGDAIGFNLGMGGELRLHSAQETPDPQRERVVVRFADGEQLWAHFWWFGHVHWLPQGDLTAHPQLGALGPEPLADDFTAQRLAGMLQGRRGELKRYLLDQRFIAGIGNVYVQDILWHAGLHPRTPAHSLDEAATARLHGAIRHVLQEGIRWGGGPSEQDLWGRKGAYVDHVQVAYRTGQPCPACRTAVEEVRVGPTTSYICPRCQTAP
ncbi:MAG: Fpg/Nei family DNA glycosylase [Chloroflexi bacterium]|nr:Fpg/Nei family DNA glycosylase [Chloroflexota bacterium]